MHRVRLLIVLITEAHRSHKAFGTVRNRYYLKGSCYIKQAPLYRFRNYAVIILGCKNRGVKKSSSPSLRACVRFALSL